MHVVTPKVVPAHLSWQGVITICEKRQIESLEATRRLVALIPEDASMTSDVQYLVSFGLVPGEIEDAMAKCRPDLVVMGVKKAGCASGLSALALVNCASHRLRSTVSGSDDKTLIDSSPRRR